MAVAQYTDQGFVLLGSGVMVGPGLLLTATHVLDEFPREGTPPAFLTFLPSGARAWLPIDISNLSGPDPFDEGQRRESDLTLVSCTLNSAAQEQHPLMLAPLQVGLPLIGERLWAMGYRHGDLVNGTASVTPLVSSGRVTAVYPQGRGQHMPAACIEVDMDTKGGMSGGPVVNANGDVVAIVSTSYDGGPSYVTLIWDALRLNVRSSVRPFSSRRRLNLFTAGDLGLVRMKGNVKRRRSGDVTLTMSDAEMALLMQSVRPDAITRADPSGGRFLDDAQMEAFGERWGDALEEVAAASAVEYLERLKLDAVRHFLESSDVPMELLVPIRAHSVEDFEGLEDSELLSARERADATVAVLYAFDLLSVVWTLIVPSSSYRLRPGDFDENFMNVEDDGTTTKVQLIQRCYFEAELMVDVCSETVTLASIVKTGVVRRRR